MRARQWRVSWPHAVTSHEWCLTWPRVTWYRAADHRAFWVHPNRYPGALIGVAVQVRRRVFSVVWATSRRRERR